MLRPNRSGLLAIALALACASDPSTAPVPGPDVPEVEPPTGRPRDPGAGLEARCKGRNVDVRTSVMEISRDFEGQRLEYDAASMQDCSGMLHQALGRFERDFCPEAAGQIPDPTSARSTDGIARFYAEEGTLVPVSHGQELTMIEQVRPGAIMFYGPRSQMFRGLTASQVPAHVRHVGLLVNVVRDESGVVSYGLFHGRRTGRPAGITHYHVRDPRRDGSPPFGNGREQWIGFAPLIASAR